MKKLLIGFLIFMCSLQSKATTGYEITVHVKGIKYGKAWMERYEDKKTIGDTVLIENGRFVLKGMIEFSTVCKLHINRKSLVIMLENKAIQIEGDIKNLRDASVKGSPLNKLYQYWASLPPDEWQGFIAQNPDSDVAAYIAYALQSDPYEIAATTYEQLGNTGKNSHYGELLKAKIDNMAKSQAGKAAPDFTIPSSDKKEIRLKDFAGKIVVIDFWASWCAPCRAAIPKVRKIYEKFKDRNVVFLSISMDDNDLNWRKALDQEKMEWLQGIDPKGFSADGLRKLYGFNSIPYMMVIDESGIVAASLHFEKQNNLEEILEKLVSKTARN